ncbi:DNA-binding response regulator, OmpR family, contains REC and winged-helix (wHTH) domain [Tenacibaculum sp. MAR_2009_124]|uniref:response regulator transcription factor n=1 Tax=Tenacibaculum sp. MAR_2009_124 TaxID=1250059 RepID=UPI0008942F2A|nr:response regulator transcription factor [Tenacibaculum sp. MAR_2009_124]SEB40438.1 DNA-binding response regulator, OmpR family, contains REC and winged-helix (wHTH) domain [Tenacibaculum sp. MAR_2009_124]
MKTKILLVEDEQNLLRLLSELLENKRYEVLKAHNGEKGIDLFLSESPNLCVLDVMLPNLSGFDLLKKIRKLNIHTPIIMLTARKLKSDIIYGLKHGADDYVTKPFVFEELELRINNLLKRNSLNHQTKLYHIGKYQFDYNNQTLTFFGLTKFIQLTNMESKILYFLLINKDLVAERGILLEMIWGNERFYNSRRLDVHISKLRKYLNLDESIKILSIRNKGYKLIF